MVIINIFDKIEKELEIYDKISIDSANEFARQREEYLSSNLTDTEEKNHEIYFKSKDDL